MGCLKKVIKFAENPFHLIPSSISPYVNKIGELALNAIPVVGTAASIAATAADSYAHSSPGQGLKSGLLAGGEAYLGSELGSAFGGPSPNSSIGSALGDIGDATGLSDAYSGSLLQNGINDTSGALSDLGKSTGLSNFSTDASGQLGDAYKGISDAVSNAYNGSDIQNLYDSGKSALSGITGNTASTASTGLGAGPSAISSSYDSPADADINGLGSNIGKGTAASLSSDTAPVGTSSSLGSASNLTLPSLGTASSLSLPTTSDINNLGTSVGALNTNPSLNAGTALSGGLNNTAGTAANLGGKVASSGLFGSSGSYLSPLASLGIGSLTNSDATNALLKANKQSQALLAPYSNGFSFSPGDLTQDPGYQFNLAQGNQALDRKQSASGNYFSGQALKDAETFGTGLADNTYNSAYNRALQGFNTGLSGASDAAQLANNAGTIKSQGDVNQGNLFSGSLAGVLGGNSYTNSGALNGGLNIQSLLKQLGLGNNVGTFGA